MKSTKNIKRPLCFAFAVIMLLSFGLTASASATVGTGDYSRPGSQYNKTVTSADILEFLLDSELGEAERNYLVAYGDTEFVYNDAITTNYVTATLDGTRLEVRADEYEYESENGSVIRWVPTRATLNGVTHELTLGADGSYSAVFLSAPISDKAAVNVVYTLKFTISSDEANHLLNYAYEDAKLLKAEEDQRLLEYEHAYSDYLLKKTEYEEYLLALAEYESDLSLYNEYLKAKRMYDEALAKYNEYLADLSAYEAAKKAREEYLLAEEQYKIDSSLYAEYLNLYSIYTTELAKYSSYTEAVSLRRSRLAAIELTKVVMTDLERSVFAAVNGNMVDTVLAERDSLESAMVGVPAAVIDLAGDSTERLRVLMADYFSYESEAARYNYYTQNYEALKENFVNLFISLDYLYSNNAVLAILVEQDKDEKYRILVAQLYLIATALSDTPVKSLDPSLVAGGKGSDKYVQFVYDNNFKMDVFEYTVTDILGDETYIVDTNKATPTETGWPAEIKEPTAPEYMAEPKKPAYVSPPDEVEPVDDPGSAPDAVEDPGDAPAEVFEPTEPINELPEPKIAALIAAYESGALAKREHSFTDDVEMTVEKTVSKYYVNVQYATVHFYDTDNTTRLYSITVDNGSSAEYVGKIPTKAEDDRAVYTFDGWSDAPHGKGGNIIGLESVSSDMILYPHFHEDIKSYTVTWIVDGEEVEAEFKYGDMPTYNGALEKPEDKLLKYSFVGWDKELTHVTGDATYTAIFEGSYIIPTSDGGAEITHDGNNYILSFITTFDTKISIEEGLRRANGKYGLIIKTKYATVTLSILDVIELYSAGACSISLNIAQSGAYSYKYGVTLHDKTGKLIKDDYKIPISISDALVPSERLKLYYTADGSRRYTKFSVVDSRVVFVATSNRIYEMSYEYSVTAASSSLVRVEVGESVYSAGETVPVSIFLADGVLLMRLYYRDAEGNEVRIDESGFRMPYSDITVVAEAEYIFYDISFESDGVLITTLECKPGEMPTPPETPRKSSDSEYSYVFIGWSESITPADKNKTYTAVFEAIPIPPPSMVEQGLTILQKASLAAIALAFLILVIVIIVYLRRYR